VQHTHAHARQLSTAREHEPNLLHCDRHTHGSARHFDLTFIDSQAMVAVDVCIDGGQGDDAEWRDNMQQYRWRALAKADVHIKFYLETISHAKWDFFKLSRSQRI
jgi:hypothetical protein